jgi:hypothetical protein
MAKLVPLSATQIPAWPSTSPARTPLQTSFFPRMNFQALSTNWLMDMANIAAVSAAVAG